jgi:two-component system chemotaxis sensor kinase CheA
VDLSRYAELFLTEGREHIAEMQSALHTMGDGDGGAAELASAIAALFRAAHNIKGMAAAMEYSTVAETAHALETLLGGVRSGEEPLTPTLVAHLFDETDALARSIEMASAVTSVTVPGKAADAVVNQEKGADDRASVARRELRSRYLRVEAVRLDALMTVAGELEIARGRLDRVARETGGESLDVAVQQVSRLIAELRDQIVTARMVPVGQVFERLPRMVRETARALQKEVDFVVDGKEIELDRSMLDEIGDPVVHMLRNAIDHGIEGPYERQRKGKPPRARLTLSAQRESNYVLIRVADAGRGIDRDQVLSRARKGGGIDPSIKKLNDTELLGVLTRSGFSTADRVTEVSGRGVGLDVVDATVRSLGGALEIRSVLGCGTAVSMRLPLTVAIVRALLARLGDETFAIPVTHVLETVELDPRTLHSVAGGVAALIRDEPFPIVRLRDVMGLPPMEAARPKAVTVNVHGRRGAIVVDDFVGQQDVVVKRFQSVRGATALFGGATILSDGAPALIVDVNSVV